MRHIDADKIDFRIPFSLDNNGDILIPLSAAKEAIAMTPTEDVVKVVRCKKCKHYKIVKDYHPYCNNVKNLFEEMEPTDFCSYGEPMEQI